MVHKLHGQLRLPAHRACHSHWLPRIPIQPARVTRYKLNLARAPVAVRGLDEQAVCGRYPGKNLTGMPQRFRAPIPQDVEWYA